MVAEGHQVASLTGALEGSERDRIIDTFRSGKAKVLITTNVLARGIDVQSVSMVINYVCLPLGYDLYYILTHYRMSLRSTVLQIPKPTCTVSAEQVGSVVSVLPLPSFMTRKATNC